MALDRQALCALRVERVSEALAAVRETLERMQEGAVYDLQRGSALSLRAACWTALKDWSAAERDLDASWNLLQPHAAMTIAAGVHGMLARWWAITARLRTARRPKKCGEGMARSCCPQPIPHRPAASIRPLPPELSGSNAARIGSRLNCREFPGACGSGFRKKPVPPPSRRIAALHSGRTIALIDSISLAFCFRDPRLGSFLLALGKTHRGKWSAQKGPWLPRVFSGQNRWGHVMGDAGHAVALADQRRAARGDQHAGGVGDHRRPARGRAVRGNGSGPPAGPRSRRAPSGTRFS